MGEIHGFLLVLNVLIKTQRIFMFSFSTKKKNSGHKTSSLDSGQICTVIQFRLSLRSLIAFAHFSLPMYRTHAIQIEWNENM